ncbi:MAG: MFS transporter [Phenylobacterium sp.]|uniref:MFS transporter n=1 Tax=Phenylobacterium sp. TaxID=1871053 RepID=UPI00391DE1E6
MTAATQAQEPRLGLPTMLSYGVGSVAFGISSQALSAAVLQLYFNQVIGLPAVWVGAAIMASLVVDAVLDPLIGRWSDHFRSRWGRRHPFMYASAGPIAFAFFFLWNPPHALSTPGQFAFMISMLVLVRLSVSLYEIPSTALAPELAPDYDKRTTLLAFRYFFGIIGGATITFLLYQVFLRQDAANPLGVLNPEGYARFGAFAAVVMFVCVLASTAATHGRIRHLHQAPARDMTLRQAIAEVAANFSNRSLLVLMLSGLVGGVSLGLTSGLSTYFYIHLWGLQSQQVSYIIAGGLIASLLGVTLAPLVSRLMGKKRAMLTLFSVSLVALLTPLSLRLLDLMPPNGSALLLGILVGDYVVTTTLGLMGFIIVTSMVADVVEDNAVRTGQRSEGLLFAANSFLGKCTTGVGAFMAGALLSLVDFPSHALPGSVSFETMRSLALAYLPTVAVLSGLSIAVLAFYRIDRATHERNLERLREAAALAEQAEHEVDAGLEARADG